MTQVGIIETPGGDEPLAKAEGDVVGFTTQLSEATAYVNTAQERLARVTAEADAQIADAQANLDRANADVDRLEYEVAAAKGAIPAAEEAQAAYDAQEG